MGRAVTRLEGRAWRRLRAAVLMRSNICHICDEPIDLTLSGLDPLGPTVDHIIPVIEGGMSELDNLASAHRDCNLSKGDRPHLRRVRGHLSWD